MIQTRGVITGLLLLGLLAGCGSSPPINYYVLSAHNDDVPAGSTPSLGVGPIAIPEYLNRDNLVTNREGNTLVVAASDRWAEPLEDNFTRVIAMNLGVLAGTDSVSVYPWPRSAAVDYQVTVDVDRFDAGANGQVVLVARWQVLAGEGGRSVRSGRTVVTEPVVSTDYEALAGAMSSAAATLSREVAAAIPSGGKGARRGR